MSIAELEIEKSKDQHIILMKDEYEPRDIKYNEVKKYFQSELTGPTLKRMEASKRV